MKAKISVSKKDILWSYIAQFFNIGASSITLPLILHMLSTEEIAMNYLMATVSTLVALLDFGFTPQISRFVTYVYSGAKSLQKEGFSVGSGEVNYSLLFLLIGVTKSIYQKLSVVAFTIMLIGGSIYMYYVTDGFTNVGNSLFIWLIFCLSTYFSIYFKYYDTLLVGRGLITQSKQSLLFSRILYIVLTYILLLLGEGLIGVVISGLIAPFIQRFLAYHYFFDKETLCNLSKYSYSKKEGREMFEVIWHNAKKSGITFLGTYCVTKFSLFIAGLYLSSSDIASYGLLMQLTSVVVVLSCTFFYSLQPQIISYRVSGDKGKAIRYFSFAMILFYALFWGGAFIMLFLVPVVLNYIQSNASLPSLSLVSIYMLITFLEMNHSHFSTFISFDNKILFVPSSLISGFAIVLGEYVVLTFSNWGLWGVILVPGIVQLSYNNWYWPMWVFRECRISFGRFFQEGINEFLLRIKAVVHL